MAAVEVHPSIEKLTAFALGTLSEDAHGAVESHIASCTSCQERAAAAPGDALTALLRSAHERSGLVERNSFRADGERHEFRSTATETPAPMAAAAQTVTMAPAVASAAPAFENLPPELAGHERYRVTRLVGAGGMGMVYEAQHRVMARTVALKVINRALTANHAAVERFRREVRHAALLTHPNIVTTYDAEDAGDTQFLVMEYVEGISLGQLVKERGPLPLAEACGYVRQAALGLQHAHERGMVHRDVKPDNLILVGGMGGMLSPGVVKVLDFGLAVLTAERGGGLTEENVVMGTPDYMAPEQAEDPRTADIRADVYSLGCTLYYLLTGKVPYPAATSLMKILAHREQPLPNIRSQHPELPAELATVLARLLAKKAADRYQTPAEVAAALEPFTRAGVPPSGGRRRPLLAALAALISGLVVAAAVVYRIQTDTGELAITTESDDVKVEITQNGKQVDIIDTKMDKRITLSLRSGSYELALKGAHDGLKLDITKAVLTRGKTVLARIERVAKGAAGLIPADAAAVKVIQPLHRLPFADGDRFFSVDVTQDGRRALASRGEVAKVRVWNVQTGQTVCDLNGLIARFTPDGKHVIATDWKPSDFNVYELPSGKLVRNFGSPDQCWSFLLSPDGTKLHNTTPTHHEFYDWSSGKQLSRFAWGQKGVPWQKSAAGFLTPDGRYFLRQPDGGGLRTLDVETGKPVNALPQLRDVPPFFGVSADGNRLLCHDGKSWKLHDVATGKQVADIAAGPGAALSGNGRLMLASTNQRDDYGVWDVDSGRLLARLQFAAPFDGLHDVRVSRDGRYAVFAGPGDFVYVFRLPDPAAEVTEKKVLDQLKGTWRLIRFEEQGKDAFTDEVKGRTHTFVGQDWTIQRQGKLLWEGTIKIVDIDRDLIKVDYTLTAGEEGQTRLCVWRIEGDELHMSQAYQDQLRPSAFPTEAGSTWSYQVLKRLKDTEPANIDPVAQPASPSDIRVLQRLPLPPGQVACVTAVAPEGKRFAVGFHGGVVVWDGKTGNEVHRFKGWMPAFTPDGKRLVTLSFTDLWVHDVATGQLLHSLTSKKDHDFVSMSPNGRHAFVHAGVGKTVYLYDVETGKVMKSWHFDAEVHSAWMTHGNVLFLKPVGSTSHVVWDVQANKALDNHPRLAKYNRIHFFLPGDKQAIVGEAGHTYLVDVADGKTVGPVAELPSPYVASSRGFADCRIVLNAYADGKLRLFDRLTASERAVLQLPDGEKLLRDHTIWIAPEGRHVCVATDRSIYLLRLPEPADVKKP